ncbi:MAG: hypothetical protein EB033_15365 [Proteobacteria bacterium]|nr:hypothetical protein [Pseudomonadota bacterium]
MDEWACMFSRGARVGRAAQKGEPGPHKSGPGSPGFRDQACAYLRSCRAICGAWFRIANATQFNKISLLTGTGAITGLNLHIGANVEPTTPDGSNQITIAIANSNTTGLSIAALSLATQGDANSAIDTLDGAIEEVSTIRGEIGAYQNRLDSMINSLGVASENAGAANSRIRDADVAKSVSEMVRTQILQQSTMAVLAQANQAPQMALQLLK